MKKLSTKKILSLTFFGMLGLGALSQPIPTLELRKSNAPTNFTFGVSTAPMTATFDNDVVNNSTFVANSPTQNVTISFQNQQFTNLNYGAVTQPNTTGSTYQTTGLVFGAGPSLATDPIVFGASPYSTYNLVGEYGGDGGPKDNMFTSNPTATGPFLGTGFKVAGSPATTNAGFEVFTTAQALLGSGNGIGSRVYFGDIVLTYNTAVRNPVVHIAGLGGSYRYLPIGMIDQPSNYKSGYFSTELELATTGVTSTLLSSNQFMSLSGNNILNNNDVNPNGGSTVDVTEIFNNLGAATGSIRINGTVQTLVYRVYLQSGTGSDFAWSVPGSLIQGATRDPFTGDIWYISSSLDKPTQQISGNVFNDRDGLSDNDINKSAGIDNPKTNAGGLFANLLNTNLMVVASVPVSAGGVYLFDNVPVGSYYVQLTRNAGIGTYAAPGTAPATVLPAGWVNTGEFIGATPGSDGSPNGRSSDVIVVSSEIKTQVNFGIERLPESVDFYTIIPTPNNGQVYTLSPSANPALPVLSGSDPEDMPTTGVLTGKSVEISSLPQNATIRYNGVDVFAGQIINGFNENLLQIVTISATVGTTSITFAYAYVDAAGKADATPNLYTIAWSGILPITLVSFDAASNNCSANLQWVSSSETNSKSFEVEVSENNTTSFSRKTVINASGTTTSSRMYNYNFAMQPGVTYFTRLKMVSNDGSFTYSDIRKVSCSNARIQITLAPNPVISSFELRNMIAGKNQVTIYGANGQIMKSQVITNTQGTVNISSFATGTYTVRIINENGEATSLKIVKN